MKQPKKPKQIKAETDTTEAAPRVKPVVTPRKQEQHLADKKGNQKQNKKMDKNNKKPDVKEVKSLAVPMKAKDKKNAKSPVGGSSLDKLKDSLKSSRFRFLNECLYKSKSSEAVEMFREDPEAFSVYHEGYRQQVTHWPTNPLDRIIKAIKKM